MLEEAAQRLGKSRMDGSDDGVAAFPRTAWPRVLPGPWQRAPAATTDRGRGSPSSEAREEHKVRLVDALESGEGPHRRQRHMPGRGSGAACRRRGADHLDSGSPRPSSRAIHDLLMVHFSGTRTRRPRASWPWKAPTWLAGWATGARSPRRRRASPTSASRRWTGTVSWQSSHPSTGRPSVRGRELPDVLAGASRRGVPR